MMTRLHGGAAIAALAIFTSAASASLVIDDYSTQIGGTGLELEAVGVGASISATDTGIGLAGTVGDRTSTLTVTKTDPVYDFADIDLQTRTTTQTLLVDGNYTLEPGNFLNSNSGLLLNGFLIEVDYAIPSTDLGAHGDAFEFEFGSGDFDIDNRTTPAFLPYEITVISGTGTDSASVLVSDEGIYTIPFAAFTGVDFTDVTGIGMSFGGEVATPDFLVGPMAVVPEPATLALLASGCVLVLRRRSA